MSLVNFKFIANCEYSELYSHIYDEINVSLTFTFEKIAFADDISKLNHSDSVISTVRYAEGFNLAENLKSINDLDTEYSSLRKKEQTKSRKIAKLINAQNELKTSLRVLLKIKKKNVDILSLARESTLTKELVNVFDKQEIELKAHQDNVVKLLDAISTNSNQRKNLLLKIENAIVSTNVISFNNILFDIDPIILNGEPIPISKMKIKCSNFTEVKI